MNDIAKTLKIEAAPINKILPLSLDGFFINNLQDPTQRPNGIPFYQWIQCMEGSGELILDNRKTAIKEGQGIFLIANTPHTYYGTTEKWITHNLLFSGFACEQILNTLGLTQSKAYQVSDIEIIRKFIANIILHQQSKSPFLDRLYSKELYTFLLDLSVDVQVIQRSEPAMENKILRVVDQYLFDHYNQPISLDTLAELVGIRKEYLCTLFKQHMYQTISLHLQKIRIAHAKNFLIHNPEKTVKEIAVLCGFESTSYFCRIFKKLANYTPDEFRKIH